ncbi:MAG: DUF4375 domain-containing protein [Bryobacterales bacterium]|nr:DUF4375 domain-containing protein [Bryobacterales bacterium]
MPSDKIPQIFTNSGIRDPLEWLRRNLDTPLNVLVARLQPGLPPIDVEAFCKCWALDHRRFPEFAKLRAVNRIREQFSGIDIDNERAFRNADAGAWSSWAWLFDPFQKSDARVIWEKLMERVKQSHWIPQSETDPNLVECFQGNDLEPREDARRFMKVWQVLDEALQGAGRPDTIIARLSQLPRGYLLLYCFQLVDGQVCNGGFDQLRHNGYGSLLRYAAELARLLDRDAMADVLIAATNDTSDVRALSDEYFRLRRLPSKDYLTQALWLFPGRHPDYFG